MAPVVGGDRDGGMRSVLEDVVLRIGLAVDDRLNLAANRNHRLAEPIELVLRFALGRLHHQRAGHRKRHGRRVESVIHQPLRDVAFFDPARLLERA